MVDSIVDNITLRSQRRGHLLFELSINTSTNNIEQFIQLTKQYLQAQAFIENSNVLLKETGKAAHIIEADYYTNMQQNFPEFLVQKQAIQLHMLQLLQQLKIELAAADKEISIKQQ
jgi:MscS family membrane protein